MAKIDIKNATIRIKDGYQGGGYSTGFSNGIIFNGGGYAQGITLVTVRRFLGALAIGDRVTIAGSIPSGFTQLTKHTVTSVGVSAGVAEVQTVTIGGSPTGGTFTLAFDGQTTAGIVYNAAAAAVQTALQALSTIGSGNVTVSGSAGGPYTVTFAGTLNNKDVPLLVGNAGGLTGGTPTITIVETTIGVPVGATVSLGITPGLSATVADLAAVTVLPHELEVKIGDGNLTYSEKKNMEYVLDRGRLSTVKEGDQVPLEVSMDFMWEFITAVSGGIATVEDALKKVGGASNWVTSSSDPCEPYSVDIEVEHLPPCTGVQNETLLFQDFRYESLDHDLRAATIAMAGKCNVTKATATRWAA